MPLPELSNHKVSSMSNAQPFFNASSPGFINAAITTILTIVAAAGITFPQDAATISDTLVNTFNTGGIYALFGVALSNIVLPVYNFIQSGLKFSLRAVFSLNTTWIAIGNLLASGLALTGFLLPSGTAEQLVLAVSVKDWMSVVSVFALTVGNTLIRFLKQKQSALN